MCNGYPLTKTAYLCYDNQQKAKMLTVKEVADRLKVSRFTVYRWINKGRLKALRIDGILRVEEEAYNELIEKGKQKKAK